MKNKLLLIVTTICAIFLSSIINGQNVDENQKNKHAIILQENNSISIIGKKSNFINFIVKKEIRVKIKDSIGLKEYSNILLPETFDPTYIFHNSEVRKLNNCLSNIKLTSYKAKITKANGNSENAKIRVATDEIKSAEFKDVYEKYYQPHLSIHNLEAGDELYLTYTYEVPYKNNVEKLTSFRVFFNTYDFKEKYNLQIFHESGMNFNVKYYNHSEPDSTSKSEDGINYFWHKTNLFSSTEEPGSRPYLTLPYLVVTIEPNELLYTLPYSFDQKLIPLYCIAARYKEHMMFPILVSIVEGSKSKQFQEIDEFIEENTKDIKKDSIGNLKIRKIHNTIADDFTYDPDTAFFKLDDTQMERIGDFLKSNKLREISRYNTYAALLSKLELGFYSTYIVDNRYGEITDEFVKPMFDSDLLFAVALKNNVMQLLYPKNSRFGYYLNELPFYFENTKTRLVQLSDYLDSHKPVNESFRSIRTHKSSIQDNERKSSVGVEIDMDKMTASFNAKILLRGQYSTLTRGIYQYNSKNNTINNLYNKKIWEINPKVKTNTVEVNVREKEFPYKTNVNTKFLCNSIISKDGNNVFHLNLKNWFNHVIYNNLSSENRALDFYPDFTGSDTYTYYVKFNKNIEIINPFTKVEIENDFGILNIDVTQQDPNTVMITSYFVTKADMIQKDKIAQVKDIYDKIQALNNSFLDFKVVN